MRNYYLQIPTVMSTKYFPRKRENVTLSTLNSIYVGGQDITRDILNIFIIITELP